MSQGRTEQSCQPGVVLLSEKLGDLDLVENTPLLIYGLLNRMVGVEHCSLGSLCIVEQDSWFIAMLPWLRELLW